MAGCDVNQTAALELLVMAGCDVNQAAFRVASTIFRRGAARGTRWADSRPYPNRPSKKIHTLIYKSPYLLFKQPFAPVAVEQLACRDFESRLWSHLPHLGPWIREVRAICDTTPKQQQQQQQQQQQHLE
jgi:hypothetical protein